MYAQSAGETQNQLVLEGVDSPETALAVGAAKAALDYAGLDVMLRSAFRALSKGQLPQSASARCSGMRRNPQAWPRLPSR